VFDEKPHLCDRFRAKRERDVPGGQGRYAVPANRATPRHSGIGQPWRHRPQPPHHCADRPKHGTVM